jgi:hypothetical protein
MTAAYSLEAHVPQLSQTVSCCIMPSENTRSTVSIELPHVLKV